jgi:hypothetical protein
MWERTNPDGASGFCTFLTRLLDRPGLSNGSGFGGLCLWLVSWVVLFTVGTREQFVRILEMGGRDAKNIVIDQA